MDRCKEPINVNNEIYLNHEIPRIMSRRLGNQDLFATYPLLSHQLYGCCQQPAAGNTWAFSAALARTCCSNLVLMSKVHHVVHGPVYGGTVPRMVRLSSDHMRDNSLKIKDLISTLKNLFRREAIAFWSISCHFKGAGFCPYLSKLRHIQLVYDTSLEVFLQQTYVFPIRDSSAVSQKYQEIQSPETHTHTEVVDILFVTDCSNKSGHYHVTANVLMIN